MSQIFIKIPDKNILFDLLNIICNINENYFLINKSSYKLAIYNNLLTDFTTKLLPYYYKSKQFYLTREINYKNFLTIIRQLCKILNIEIIYNTIFHKSIYEINYKIIIDN
jgi:hypothetical protein